MEKLLIEINSTENSEESKQWKGNITPKLYGRKASGVIK